MTQNDSANVPDPEIQKRAMDFVFFFYGLSFCYLALVCATLSAGARRSMAWGWLALFGAVHGANEWLDLIALTWNPPLFGTVRLLAAAASFSCLLEFGRSSLASSPGRWVHLVPLALLAAGWDHGPQLVRYLLGFPAGALAAWALWSASSKGPCRAELRWAAAGMGLYAAAAGLVVPNGPFFPADRLNCGMFLGLGVPIQLIRGVLAFLVSFAVWRYSSCLTGLDRPYYAVRGRFGTLLAGGLLACLAAGYAATELVTGYVQDDLSHALIRGGDGFAPAIVAFITDSTAWRHVVALHRMGVLGLTAAVSALFATFAVFLGRAREHAAELAESRDRYREAGAALARVNGDKDRLMQIIAHDLRGPVGNLRTFIELLRDDVQDLSPEALRATLHDLHGHATMTCTMIENLLTWTRSQTGGIRPDPAPVDLGLLARQVVAAQSSAKGVALSVDVPEGAKVMADGGMLSCILRNLASNAQKFTPRGGSVVISARPGKGGWIVSVKDTGVGMPKAMLDNLLSLACVESRPRKGTDGEQGTGLGLLIAKDFVCLHGGTIWATSEVGQGSEISFSLPQAGPAAEVPEAAA